MKIRNLKLNRGMTFIELIVVISIFATISGVVLFNFTGFSTNISLQNLANQIALQLKKAQTQALSGTGGSALFGINKPSYGIVFDTTKPSEFDFFADGANDYGQNGLNEDNLCNGLGECLDRITIQTGDTVSKLAVGDVSVSTCPNVLTVTFRRPFPDANFYVGGVPDSLSPKVGIEITSPKQVKKTIIVWSTGQIEIKNNPISVDFPPCQ